MRRYLLNHGFVVFIVICTFFLGIPQRGVALPSESVSTLDRQATREAQIERIMETLDRPEAKTHLMVMGISKSQLKEQLSQLDDFQLALVSEKADTVSAAGNGAAAAVLIVLFVVVIIFMIFYFGPHGHHHI
jgi:predicted PurR-regulated permease PerM